MVKAEKKGKNLLSPSAWNHWTNKGTFNLNQCSALHIPNSFSVCVFNSLATFIRNSIVEMLGFGYWLK